MGRARICRGACVPPRSARRRVCTCAVMTHDSDGRRLRTLHAHGERTGALASTLATPLLRKWGCPDCNVDEWIGSGALRARPHLPQDCMPQLALRAAAHDQQALTHPHAIRARSHGARAHARLPSLHARSAFLCHALMLLPCNAVASSAGGASVLVLRRVPGSIVPHARRDPRVRRTHTSRRIDWAPPDR